jgi:signal transduction histidine kinase
MRSLRTRLLATTVAVALVALALVGLLSRRVVTHELRRVEAAGQQVRLQAAADLLDNEARAGEPLDPALGRAAVAIGSPLVLLGADGSLVAASSPRLREARIRAEGDRLTIETEVQEGGALRTARIVLLGTGQAVVQGRDGTRIGTLHAVPEPGVAPGGKAVEAVSTRLLLATLLSAVVAVGLALALSRRILGPVEEVTAAARRMAEGDRELRVAVRSDDEVGALAGAFNAMADAVARAEAGRRSLVADVAHELRTPLTNLRCHLEALQDGLQKPDSATLASLHEETLLLSRLVDDLQELSLAEAGQLALQPTAFDLAPAVDAALAAVRARAEAREVRLVADMPETCAVHADPARVSQVLRNLLANAITHTPEGGTVTVAARTGADRVAVSVEDTGRGIAAEDLPHVFDRFYRADASRTRATGGAGLGLAIVRQLVEAHGGQVSATSEPGHGSRFTFTLPALTGSSQEPRIPL